jgi:glycosyltransferase involved in cell wall biosynthesis
VKILIHSNGPMVPSGYGKQVRLLAPRLKAAGHEVAVSAFYGLSGSPIMWEGIPLLPAGSREFGTDVLPYHAANHGAELVITLMDFWKLQPCAEALQRLRVLAWLPTDCDPLGRPDAQTLARSGAQPVAMSRFGERVLTEAGFSSLYAPHAVDTSVFKPPADRHALRTELGLDDFFLIGINAANRDALRKGWPEQFQAFKRLRQNAPEARLMVHSEARSGNGFPLDQLAEDMGIADAVIFSDQYALVAGLMDDETMAGWYGCLDVLSACSYAEAFCVPLIESQACGTPVITTGGSAMEENVWSGWRVQSDPYWNPVHRAWWDRPSIDSIATRYGYAYEQWKAGKMERRRAQAVAGAGKFNADDVVARYWLPILEAVGAMDAVDDEQRIEAEAEGWDDPAAAEAVAEMFGVERS